MPEQNNFYGKSKNNSSLKAVIAVLAVLLVGSLVYIVKMTSDAKALQTELTKTSSEKDSVTKDLEALKATYDAAIAENTSMSDELIAEREKVVNLLADLKDQKETRLLWLNTKTILGTRRENESIDARERST